jgi:hypothetical protein
MSRHATALYKLSKKLKKKGDSADWHRLRKPESKRLLNITSQELKELNNNKYASKQSFKALNHRTPLY